MSNNDGLYIRTGFVPDKASNAQSIAELEKVKGKVLDVQKAVKDTSSNKLDIGGTAGSIGGSAGKVRGVASMFGGGEFAGLANDLGDAVEGASQLGSTLLSLGPAGVVAAAAVVAVTLVLGDLAKGAAEQAAELDRIFNAQRSVFDEIAGGATTADIQESIAALQFRRELEKITLQEATEAYASYEQQIRDTFGAFGDIILGILRIIDPREESLNAQKEESQKNIQESEARERAYNDALEKGLTSKADAKAAEEQLQKDREKAARDAEKAAAEQKREAEKQAREAEQRAKEAAQLRMQQEDMAVKNAESIKKINQGAVDNIKDIQQKARDAAIDGRNKFIIDLNNLTQKHNDDELGAVIKANQAERQALKEHQRTIQNLIDQAADAEEDARDNRNFLQLVQARRDAQKEINKEPENFKQGAEDREAAFEDERQERMRQFEIARRDTRQAYQQEDAERRAGIGRALRDNQTNKQRQLRDQAAAYQAEQAMFNRHNQDKLGMLGQFMSAEMSMLQGAMNGMRGGGSRSAPASPLNMFNNSRTTNNTTLNLSPIGTGGMMGALRVAGFGRR